MHGLLEQAFKNVDNKNHRASLLRAPEEPGWPGPTKLQYAMGEWTELGLEFEHDGTRQFSSEKTAGENADIFVFLRAWLVSQLVDLDLTRGASFINGAGGRSDSLERLQWLLLETEDDPRAAREAILLIVSLHGHLGLATSFLETLQQIDDKLVGNRPPSEYTDTEGGKPLTTEEKTAKYQFKERAFRMIRKAVERTSGREVLRESDWLPYRSILAAWREGEPKLIELRAILAVELGEDQQTPMGVFVPNPAQTYLYGGRGSQHIQ